MVALLAGFENAHGYSLILDWNASASPNTVGYNVYYGTTSGNYPNKLNAGNALSDTISNLTAGVTYYFVATAYDANGNESPYSAQVSFIVPGILTLTPGANPGSPATIQFPAAPGHWYEVQATTNLLDWDSIWQSNVAVSNAWMQCTDPNAAAFASRFYRLVLH
jgi:hypothetical protein